MPFVLIPLGAAAAAAVGWWGRGEAEETLDGAADLARWSAITLALVIAWRAGLFDRWVK
jgi:hypothetical protein